MTWKKCKLMVRGSSVFDTLSRVIYHLTVELKVRQRGSALTQNGTTPRAPRNPHHAWTQNSTFPQRKCFALKFCTVWTMDYCCCAVWKEDLQMTVIRDVNVFGISEIWSTISFKYNPSPCWHLGGYSLFMEAFVIDVWLNIDDRLNVQNGETPNGLKRSPWLT